MTTALAFTQELSDADLDWLFAAGEERSVGAEHVLVEEGVDPDSLFIVLDGLFSVRYRAIGEQAVARLGPGQLVGDMSFLERSPAAASVVSDEPSRVLCLARARLAERLAENLSFAARCYRALAVTNAARLRLTVGALGLRLQPEPGAPDPLAAVRSVLDSRLADFKELMVETDRDALANTGVVPEARATEVGQAFDRLALELNGILGSDSPLPATALEQLGRVARRELLPFLLLTRNGERVYAKPRGYAGDFLTIEWLYDNQAAGTGRIGPLLDACLLASRQHRPFAIADPCCARTFSAR